MKTDQIIESTASGKKKGKGEDEISTLKKKKESQKKGSSVYPFWGKVS